MSDILVIVAHPQLRQSRVNAALMAAAAQVDAGRIDVCDLYARYPDYFIDVAAEQSRLSAARLIVWQYPVQWYGMPALMKLWLDEVFAFGWAYGPGGTALRGKPLWPVLSTGGTAESYGPGGYNRHPIEHFLLPLQQTAALTGLCLLPPHVIHGAHRLDDRQIAAEAETYRDRLQRFPAWVPPPARATDDCRVPADARPQSA